MGIKLLTHKFLNKYEDFPSHMNALGTFVYLRTYSRYLPNEKRRETWKETIARSVEYNVSLAVKHLEKIGVPVDFEVMQKEAEELFDAEFNLKQSLSGRTKWVGGAEGGVAEKYPLANFNCSFLNISSWADLGDLFYLLLVGTGVGFKSTLEMASELAPVRNDVEIEHMHYFGKLMHIENSVIREVDEQTVMISVGDSKEGWVESLNLFFKVLTSEEYEHVKKIRLDYRHIREKGARLKTFGGTASGPQPLQEMFEGFTKVLRNQIDETLAPLEVVKVTETGATYVQVRPVHILDMGNLIGNNVVVGGVRRTAEIFLFDADDFESLWAKYGVNGYWKEADFKKHEALKAYCEEKGIQTPEWFDKIGVRNYDETVNVDFVTKEPRREEDGSLSPFNYGTGFYHRAMSNNSIAFIDKPSFAFLDFVFEMMKTTGEPGFINLYEAARRRLVHMGITNPTIIRNYAKLIGLNPCAEILLSTYGVCNLTTVNAKAFAVEVQGRYFLDRAGLLDAFRRSARAGLRMTLVELELPHWAEVQNRDRLIGPSVTCWKDMLALCGYDADDEAELLQAMNDVVKEESAIYAKALRVSQPLLDTTVKPEGTLTQVFGGGSSGLHYAHSEYFIRRVRINAEDSLAKAVLAHEGWTVNPENGTQGATREEKMQNARTLVIDFPVHSGTKVTKDDVSVAEQFKTYFRFQKKYTSHNSSNTITVRDNEWSVARDIVWKNWENFVGVSFLAHDGGTYQLPPYEAITKEQYENIVAQMTEFDIDVLTELETGAESDLDGAESCENGICPIR
jgi:ribonucleoside-triphosphate reductase (thioredoxin)